MAKFDEKLDNLIETTIDIRERVAVIETHLKDQNSTISHLIMDFNTTRCEVEKNTTHRNKMTGMAWAVGLMTAAMIIMTISNLIMDKLI